MPTLSEIGLGLARFALPKSLERKFGIAKPQMTFEVGAGLTEQQGLRAQQAVAGDIAKFRGATDVVRGEFFSDPDEFKRDVKAHIQDLVKSGVTDKKQIKTSVKNIVKQKINERLIAPVLPPSPPTISGFLKNVKRNTEEIVDGLGALIGLGFKKVIHPIEGLKGDIEITKKLITSPQYRQEVKNTFINPVIDEYKEYRHPIHKLYEDPLDVIFDATAILSLAGILGVKTGAKIATTAGRVTPKGQAVSVARQAQKVAQTPEELLTASRALREAQQIVQPTPTGIKIGRTIEAGGEALQRAATPFSFKNVSNATKKVLQAMPGGNEVVQNLELASQARKLLQKEQLAFLNVRNSAIKQIDDAVKVLSPEEVKALPPSVEGFATPIQGASNNFYKALGLMKALANDQARFGLKIGKLTPEIIERRRFQPMAKWLENQPEFQRAKISGGVAGQIEDLTGAELLGYLNTIKKFFPDADPIYMRHFFEDQPKNFKNFFLNTKPVRTFKPGFLKKSYGVEGYIGSTSDINKKQLTGILTRQATENIKWQSNINLIEQLKTQAFTKPLKAGEDLLPGHRVFAPDGFLRFYRGTIDMADEWKKALAKTDNVWDAFEDAITASLPKQKHYIGVTKNVRLYQVPEAVAGQLEKVARSTNPYLKLFYDKPLDAFRASVLSLFPRWHVNNIVGNLTFSVMSGDIFNPKAFHIQRQARKQGLIPDELFGGVHRIEKTTSGRLGTAADIPFVKSTVAMHDALLNTTVIGTVVKNIEKSVNFAVVKPLTKIVDLSFRANQYVDDAFKGAALVNRVLKTERKNFITRMVTDLDDSLKMLEKAKKLDLEKMIDDVHSWYYHGLNLTDFERRIVRRVIPFYSWMRWVSLYSLRIATEAPVRATILKNVGRDFYLFTGQNKLPDWLKGSVPIGTDEDGTVYYLTTRGPNPFNFVNDVLREGLVEAVIQGVAPLPKTIIERTVGRELFSEREFTREDIQRDLVTGKLYRFDPETQKVVEVSEKIKPGFTEQLLRNYLPQYLLLEAILTGGNIRYTAEGMDEILKDLFKDPTERKAVVKDLITKMPKESSKTKKQEVLQTLGVNIKRITPEHRISAKEALERATSAIKNKQLPILNPQFKDLLRKRMIQEIRQGTKKEELAEKLRIWVGRNVEQLQLIR